MNKKILYILAIGSLLAACGGTDQAENFPLIVERTEGIKVYQSANTCEKCHEQHVKEWRISNHAYAAKDPVYHAMTRMGQMQSNGKLGQFCIQCHSPVAFANKSAPVYFDAEAGIYKQDTENLGSEPGREAEGEGVTCDVCHSLVQVIEEVNARADYLPDNVKRGGIRDPVPTNAHESKFDELQITSTGCGPCHAVTNPKGAKLEETFGEWEASSFNRPGGKTCQDCHMPEYKGRAASQGAIDDQAIPERTLHRHIMPGVDVSLLPPEDFPGYEELRIAVRELLQESAEIGVMVDTSTKAMFVSIKNLAGHALPSGATAERQMWLEVIVTSTSGAVVFESGTWDSDENLRVNDPLKTTMPGTDPQLVLYFQQMYSDPKVSDPNSTAPSKKVNFPWQSNKRVNYLIAADATDVRKFDLSALPPGSYEASVKLKFRAFPPYFLKELEEKAGLDPRVRTEHLPTVDMEETTVEAFDL